jgi:alanine-synthesizing transaminase
VDVDTSFYRISKLPPYVFAEINQLKAEARTAGRDVVDLGMGNPDGATPKAVVDKLCQAARDRRNHRYSLSRGIRGLRQALAERYSRRYGVSLDAEAEAITTIGAKDAIAHLLFAIIGPGDRVVTPTPAYPIHVYGVLMAEGAIVRVPLTTPAEFLDALERVVSRPPQAGPEAVAARDGASRGSYPGGRVKAVLVSFPQNPTTTTVEPEFFERLVALAKRHEFWVIHDFAYADLGFDGYEAPSFLQAAGAKDVGVEIYSLSKSYNMAGWRVGFCLGNRELVKALARIKSYLDYGNFQAIQIAAAVALRECDEAAAEIRETYRRRRDVLVAGLKKCGWQVDAPRGSMFVWAPIPEQWASLGSLEFARRMLNEALVAVSPGVGFGEEGEGFVRFALVENESRIRQALRGIGQMSAAAAARGSAAGAPRGAAAAAAESMRGKAKPGNSKAGSRAAAAPDRIPPAEPPSSRTRGGAGGE